MRNIGLLTSSKTPEAQEMYTPFYAVDPIIPYLEKYTTVWSPFDKEWSAFYQRLTECGFNVIRSHIEDNQDFFTYEPDEYDVIVSNPPFSIKDKILERLYELNKPFAVLLPLNSLQGIKRFVYFQQGIQLLSFDERIEYHNPAHMDEPVKGAPFATAYFCRDVLPKDLIVEHLVKYRRSLL